MVQAKRSVRVGAGSPAQPATQSVPAAGMLMVDEFSAMPRERVSVGTGDTGGRSKV